MAYWFDDDDLEYMSDEDEQLDLDDLEDDCDECTCGNDDCSLCSEVHTEDEELFSAGGDYG
jgi:hypothetical protein